ncbi:hypothetical protein AGMMS4956_20950 [Bacteroidia bacterium]|nr:hypothetical protein AGMMS4956_20950 [Bacteroidia bacterium]
MSPLFKETSGFEFRIFSNEENRIHIHIFKAEKEAKYWLEPIIELEYNYGFSSKELQKILQIIIQNETEFKQKYKKHIG